MKTAEEHYNHYRLDVIHILESGANEVRIKELITRALESYSQQQSKEIERLQEENKNIHQHWADCEYDIKQKDQLIKEMAEDIKKARNLCMTYKNWTDAESAITEVACDLDETLSKYQELLK